MTTPTSPTSRRAISALLRVLLCAGLLGACTDARTPEKANWFDSGQPLDVTEAVAWTDAPYDFPASGDDGLLQLRQEVFGCYDGESVGDCDGSSADPDAASIQVAWGAEEIPLDQDGCYLTQTSALPADFEVMVTLRPQFYFKARDCKLSASPEDNAAQSDKFYASFFVEDATGGMLVLADSRIAHFDAGDQLRMRVRSLGRQYDMDAVYAYDIERIDRGPQPVYYSELADDQDLGPDHRGKVMRVQGQVLSEVDGFGHFVLQPDGHAPVDVQLSLELNRRGLEFPPGAVVRATGPVLYSFSSHAIVITQVGQLELLEDPADASSDATDDSNRSTP